MSYYLIIRGPLGCGKSTIARRLARMLKAEYVAVDRVLDEHHLTKDHEQGYISQKSFLKANKIIAPQAKRTLQQGTPVIFDGNFYWKSSIEDLIKRLKIGKLPFPHYVFTLKAPLRICIERDRKRSKKHGEEAVRAVYKKATGFKYGVVMEVTKSTKKVVKEIVLHLLNIKNIKVCHCPQR